MHILIAGKNSYIGSSFKSFVYNVHNAENWQIDLISVRNHDWENMDFSGYDAVICAAAVVHRKEHKEDEKLYRTVNYELPVKLAEKALKAGVTQFIFLSTMAVYGSDCTAVTKTTPLKPVNYYAKYKKNAEDKLIEISGGTMKTVIIRPPVVYGKDCKGNFSRLVKLSKICFLFPDTDNKRSMIFIDNLCEYMYLVIKNRYEGIGNPHNTEPVNTAELVKEIRKAKGKNTYTTKLFNGLIRILAKKISVFKKMFGDCYYLEDTDKAAASIYQIAGNVNAACNLKIGNDAKHGNTSEIGRIEIDTACYQTVDFSESIRRSI